MFDVVAFDADDTLWFSEDSFRKYETQFVDTVAPYVPVGVDIKAALIATERKNIDAYGYGVKSFGLSSMEAAITLSNGEIPSYELQKILHGVREHLTEPVRLFDGVAEVLAEVSSQFRTILITKGDLAHQTRKVETSGISHHFDHVEIVLEKDPATYAHVLKSLDINPKSFCMVGNSMKSDILPVISIGGFGVYVPYEILWELDHAEHPTANADRYVELETLSLVPEWLAQQHK
ncbi:haloacid dehalogenase [Actinomycetes bacterium]|nr:haloacid dehalogenase [Actinomycetes bacterium]